MTLQQLIYFKTLANVLHYTKAAKQLYISQPNLSYAITELEKELGVPLFEKEKNKIRLSIYGEDLLIYVTKAMNFLERGEQSLAAIKNGFAGHVLIGYIYSLSTNVIPSFIHDFNEKYPANKIKFRFKQNMQTGLVDALLDDKLDMILSGEADMRLESIPLMEQELFLVVSKDHPLASRESVEFAEVGREPFIMLGQESSLRQFLDGHFIKARIRPDVVVEAFECSGALQYVAQNLGVTIIPHTPSVDFLPVKLIKIKTPGFKRQIYLSWRQDRPDTPLFNLVRKFIQERFLLAYDI